MSPILSIVIASAVGIAAASLTMPSKSPAVPFPSESQRRSRADLRAIASRVESQLNMPGFADFAVGVAQNESRFNNLAIDDSAPALRAAREGYANNPKRYGASPYPANWYSWGTGGWYQLLPSTALADRPWNHANPMLVFDPVASTFLLAAFIQRVQRNHFHNLPPQQRNWLAVRRFLKSNKAGYDWAEELPATAPKRKRFGRDLEMNGIPSNFMYHLVPTGTVRATPEQYQAYLSRTPSS